MKILGKSARTGLMLVGCASVAFAVGSVIGALAWHASIIGLLGLVTGLGLGFCAVFFSVWLLLPRRLVRAVALGSLPIAFVAFMAREDSNQLRAWREELAEARAAETGLPPEDVARLVESGGENFLARDAESLLDVELERTVGATGRWGRLLSRLDAGVRLGGGVRQGRGLPVGRGGSVVAWLLEMLLAAILVIRVSRRADGEPGARG